MVTFKKSSKLEENKDENCRLRYVLNVNCFADTFQYLDSDDLFTLGTMNIFYKEVINDYIIRNHLVVIH